MLSASSTGSQKRKFDLLEAIFNGRTLIRENILIETRQICEMKVNHGLHANVIIKL